MRSISLLLCLLPFFTIRAAFEDSAQNIQISGYMESYYSYDFGRPEKHLRPSFFYNYNRHNEFNLNLAYVKASLSKKRFRSNLALMGGTYSTYNLAQEKGFIKNIFEANIGFKISKQQKIWLDIGVMPSHIGFESAIGKDCWNLTRSILAENSPYYESGFKLNFTSKNDALNLSFLVLNGWQKIMLSKYYRKPAIGTQLNYKANKNLTFNWSTYLGNGGADSLNQKRFFNNTYAQYQITTKFQVIVGLDYGLEQKRDSNERISGLNTWFSPIIVTQYALNKTIKIATRIEYYSDPNNVIITTINHKPFQTFGYSMNIDFQISKFALFRIEARTLQSKASIFLKDKLETRSNHFVTSSISVPF
ncbi:MAG: porin [bacterium]|nr:porin [bacterium]